MNLYIHIPFCKSKCSYCDFISGNYPEIIQDKYTNALIKEIDNFFCSNACKNIETIYFGGGTPSSLSRNNIRIILDNLSKYVNFRELREFTFECNPESVDEELSDIFKKHFINRISMGVQSANISELKLLGRIHDFETVKKAISILNNSGIQNINMDLIFHLPNRTISDIKYSLDEFIKLKPTHISCYSLIFEEGTPLTKMLDDKKIFSSNDDEYVNQYRFITDYLNQNGYLQYEISNYAKTGYESIHNTAYWSDCDYIGLGVSAHSKLENYRFANITDVERYIELLSSEKNSKIAIRNSSNKLYKKYYSLAVDEETIEILDDKSKLNELFFLGLRKTVGISLDDILSKVNSSDFIDKENLMHRINESIDLLCKKDLLQKNEDRISLTQKGRELSNSVFVELME